MEAIAKKIDCEDCFNCKIKHKLKKPNGDGHLTEKDKLLMAEIDYNKGIVRCKKGMWSKYYGKQEKVYAMPYTFYGRKKKVRREHNKCECFDGEDMK